MRNTSPFKPRERPARSAVVIARWKRERREWLAAVAPTSQFHLLFDHIPGVYFFAKNKEGKLMFASEGLRQRYDMVDETDIIGMTDFDLNPDSMARAYVDDDNLLLRGECKLLERIELWWDRQQMPDWFMVTKLPMHDGRGRVIGIMGILRRPDEAERQLPVFQTVAQAVEIIRRDYSQPLRIAAVARVCGQSLRQLQRHFRSAFGISPQEFLIKTRVLAASRLIESSALSTAEIAARCGFVDASSFSQLFRKRTGQSPRQYRGR
jgi:AraC-like DNA-binding protein